MKDALIFTDLLFANVTFGYKVVVVSLVLEISQIDFINYARVIFFEKVHIFEQIISVIF